MPLRLAAACAAIVLVVRPPSSLPDEPRDGVAAAADPAAQTRTPWINTRLVGSPEPPLPYTVEKTFTKIDWKAPMYIAPEPGSDKLWVVLQGGDKLGPGRIVRLRDDPDTDALETLLELDSRLIYALTFHPAYESSGQVFVFYNGPLGAPERTNRVSRFSVSRQPPFRLDPSSEKIIIEWRSMGHDGGDLAFGRDGMLYITAGDGTSDSDTWNSGQDVSNLLATLIRIDVDHPAADRPYAIPPDNPFLDLPGARPEIWAYGFRNPWRMSVDAKTGDVWVGNNGQDLWETAYLVHRGDNFGWSVYEGSHPFYSNRKRGPTPIVPPTIEHHHSEFRSLTGGVVYYGDRLAELNGAYIYGDYSTGVIAAARHRDGHLVWQRELADTSLQIVAFRVDQRGELLVADLGGGIYRVVPRPAVTSTASFPTRLSDTGLFVSTSEYRVHSGLIPYSVNAAGWADGAAADRFIALPGASKITYRSSQSWACPDGTALVQTLFLETEPAGIAAPRRIETRVLLKQEGEWAGYTYRWNDEQTDAWLVGKEGEDIAVPVGKGVGYLLPERPEGCFAQKVPDPVAVAGGTRRWRIPSRAECLTCHSRAANFVLGLSTLEMNRERDYGGRSANQLDELDRRGVFAEFSDKSAKSSARLVDPYDSNEDLDQRARSYLHTNCSVCHVDAGGGNAKMELEFTRSRDKMNLIGARPQHDSFAISNAMLVAPGDPGASILLYRIARRGTGQMPPLVTSAVDQRAVELMREWIRQMKPENVFVRAWSMDDLVPKLDALDAGRSAASGKQAFEKVGCAECHRFAGAGGTVGPDLTGVGKRLSKRELLESVLEPSKVVADEYASYLFALTSGRVISGRLEREERGDIVIRTGAGKDDLVRVATADIAERQKSASSNMPAEIVNVLESDQILDMLAYLIAEGNPDAASFK